MGHYYQTAECQDCGAEIIEDRALDAWVNIDEGTDWCPASDTNNHTPTE